jgi:hypothetical protein
MIENLNSKNFREHLNSEFKVQAPDGQALSLRLTEVTERDTNPRAEQFSIFFLGPRTPLLEQRIYHLKHEKLGEFDLFVVPVGMEADGVLYECVFNRFRKPEAMRPTDAKTS